MKHGFLVFCCPVFEDKTDGVAKKLHAQARFLSSFGACECINIPLPTKPFIKLKLLPYLFSKDTHKNILQKIKNADFLYVRKLSTDSRSTINFLHSIKEANPHCKILYEIPTYPYDKESRTVFEKFLLLIDRHYRVKLHEVVDRIITLSDDDKIFGCPTLRIRNGVEVESIPVSKKESYDPACLNLIAVAQFSFWHGYERAIEGLRGYYAAGGSRKIVLYLVGDGPELEKYRSLVGQYEMEEHIVFHGTLSGCRLTEAFDTADIALCSLAAHRVGIYEASFLKSREYLSRGLPIVSSTKIDIIPDGCRFCLRVPEDDGPLDMQKIIAFADGLYGEHGEKRISCRDEIRAFAEQTCGMDSSMRAVTDYLQS